MANEKRARWSAARLVVVMAVMALVGGNLVAGCSLVGGDNLTEACQNAREEFGAWLDANQTADTGFNHAHNQWADANAGTFLERGVTGAELTAVIDAYNADLQTGQTAQATADQALVRFNQVRGKCTEPELPKECQGEFAQYALIIDNAARAVAADAAATAGITAEQEGLRQGSRTVYNAAVDAVNAAVAQHNDIANEWNVTLKPAYNAAIDACNNAN